MKPFAIIFSLVTILFATIFLCNAQEKLDMITRATKKSESNVAEPTQNQSESTSSSESDANANSNSYSDSDNNSNTESDSNSETEASSTSETNSDSFVEANSNASSGTKINTFFECPKCGLIAESEGSCPKCSVSLIPQQLNK
ncbi:MAG: hypothetical protein HQM10_10500 [Candidatus Riflebacteria bacterium]|nr:hypothetical protein [Candidatus Riflebacteria bacterium]